MANPRRDKAPIEIALVDCYANERVFIGDTTFRTLAEQLRADGFEASFHDLVRDQPPTGRSIDDVVSALAAADPDHVVVSRVWGSELVDRLRQATRPETTLIRYSHGAPSPIDDSFDSVLDSEGVRAFVAGNANPAAPSWRRSKREMAAKNTVATPHADARPTISGPARGCPFLVDVRTSPAYRDSGIDFDKVQSKGCSFCLDNVGAFAAFPPQQVVETWLGQLRALRAERPELREVLLTDERPHPELPALFRAILDEPVLHGIELLIKSRVDWLEEFADTAMREACDLAAQSGSVVHLYLVGFESFHQADLDLFNKAVTVADNIRAVDTLARLEARHPESFEFRRHRAHGIVLFHPWTTPESLLDNARVMRQVDFHELRTETLRTRLRLYASVPLHALAERQGLLVEHFDDGRTDRAAEQGYDASVPWKFADSRIEAIFQGASHIAQAGVAMDAGALSDADILEMVTTFVERWPAFADTPELTAYPILQSIYGWGASPAAVAQCAGAPIAGFDREVEAVAAGTKPACLKEGVAAGDADALVRAYRTMGLASRVVSAHDRGDDDGRHGRGDSHRIVAVARDEATLEQVLKHQRGVESGDASQIPAMGELMGYPSCCVAAFAAKRTHGDNLQLEHAPFLAHPERPLAPMLNRFGAVSLISHMLCSPDCPQSIDIAQTRLDAAAQLDSDAAGRIASHLAQSILRLDYRRAAVVDGGWDGDRYRMSKFEPLAGADLGLDTDSVEAVAFGQGGLRFVLQGAAEDIVLHLPDGHAAVLVEPSAPLAPAILSTLGRAAAAPPPSRDSNLSSPPTPTPQSGGTAIADILEKGTKVGNHRVDKAESDGAGGYLVTLLDDSGGKPLLVQLRPWQANRPALSRRGPWALDLRDGQTGGSEPSDTERRAIGALARLLPAGHQNHDQGSAKGSPGPSPRRATTTASRPTDGVVCTAPWTTLEVVDPDGRVRQCCGDWTVGDRGNLHDLSLADVWNGDGYRMARQVMAKGPLNKLCHKICPRLYDGKFAERELSIVPGAEPFVRNQQQLIEDIAARRDVVRGNPLYVAVCPSTYCNYDCIMCTHGRSPRRELSERIWDELLAMLPTLKVLTLLGGEPLANPSAMKFLQNWDREQYPDASVSVITNGSLLGPNVLDRLEGCRFGNVTISLNAGSAEAYRNVQRGIELDEVIANLDALLELRKRQGSDFPVVLSFVVQPANHATLLEFGELARTRRLPIRLMPLSTEGVEELDFYDDPDQVARVIESLDAMNEWAKHGATEYLQEIRGTRNAIASEAARRKQQGRGEQPTAAI